MAQKSKDKIIEEQDEIIESLSEELLRANLEIYKLKQEKKSHEYLIEMKTPFNYVSNGTAHA